MSAFTDLIFGFMRNIFAIVGAKNFRLLPVMKINWPNILIISLYLLFSFLAIPTFASLQINPVSLEFSPKSLIQEITIENQSGDTRNFEISLKSWKQENDKDIYNDTSDIIVFPLTVKLTPRSKQKFRLIAKKLPEGSTQGSYRLFFSERPNKTMSKAENSVVTFLLDMTVPVFALGANYKFVEKTDWSYEILKKNNLVVLSLNNNGSKFLKLKNLTIKEAPSFKSGNWQYVLPGTRKSWNIDTPKGLTKNSFSISYIAAESLEEVKKSATAAQVLAKMPNPSLKNVQETKLATKNSD